MSTMMNRPFITVQSRLFLFRRRGSSSSTFSSSSGVLLLTTLFQEQVAQGRLKADGAQDKVIKRLSRLQQALVDYDNHVLFVPPPTLLPSPPQPLSPPPLSSHEPSVSPPVAPPPTLKIPRGLYLYGSVGTGKSMLMDAFFQHAPVTKKSRFHFHSFLGHVHQHIHTLKQRDLQEHGRNFTIDRNPLKNPIYRVGMEIAQSTSLLCLDEFQVTDIADAVILSQLFGVLFRKGTVVVTTSNRPPHDLYEDGLNREYFFLPFLTLLHQHCIVHEIQSSLDYRRLLANHSSSSISSSLLFSLLPSSCNSFFGSDEIMQPVFQQVLKTIVQVEDDTFLMAARPRSMQLSVGFQRTLSLDHCYQSAGLHHHSHATKPKDSNGNHIKDPILLHAVQIDVIQLCDADVGSMDFSAIAQYFDIVYLSNVPIMDLEGHNRARRFITLVDELYEGKCCLILSTTPPPRRQIDNKVDDDDNAMMMVAETPMDLFRTTPTSRPISVVAAIHEDDDPPQQQPPPLLGVDMAIAPGGVPVGSLASVRELSFAFERASSRIVEMCSPSWWEKRLAERGSRNETI